MMRAQTSARVTLNNNRILIITQEIDPHADAMVVALKKKGVRPVRFHTKDFPTRASINIQFDARGGQSLSLNCDGGSLEAGDIRSVWYRRPDKCELPGNLSKEERPIAFGECQEVLHGLYRTLGGFWVNPPDNNRIAESKILQAKRAIEVGLRVPDTLITNDPDKFKEFYHAHAGNIIVKMQRQTFWSQALALSIFTSKVDLSKLEHSDLIRNSPCLFQENIPKDVELRITVIGRRLFAVAIHSQEVGTGKVDWRRAESGSVPHTAYTLPKEIEDKLLALVDGFGLHFGAIDMIVTPEGEYVFLEINPNGQFGWLEDVLGLELFDTFADLLINGKN